MSDTDQEVQESSSSHQRAQTEGYEQLIAVESARIEQFKTKASTAYLPQGKYLPKLESLSHAR